MLQDAFGERAISSAHLAHRSSVCPKPYQRIPEFTTEVNWACSEQMCSDLFA